MDCFNDLDIPESLDEALQPTTLALVVYDMQVGILSQVAGGDHVLANVLRVLAAARERRAIVADTDAVTASLLGSGVQMLPRPRSRDR